MKRILILCTGNSCRSQMAEGFLRHYGGDDLEVYSAGIETHGVNQKAIQVMQEAGIDISHHTSNHIDEFKNIAFDYVVTVCDHAKENCPYFPTNAIRIHQNFTDPAKASGSEHVILQAFRDVRDQISGFVRKFVSQNFK